MFKLVPFFQKHFRKCSIPAYIHQKSLLPSGLLGSSQRNLGQGSQRQQGDDSKISKNSHYQRFHIHNLARCASPVEHQPQSLQTQVQLVDILIDRLRPLEKATLVRTRTVRKTVGFLHDAGIVAREFEVLNTDEVKIFDVEIQQGDVLEEFSIKVYDINSNALLCLMHLESDLEMKSLVLKILHPNKTKNKNVIGSVCETKGMSKIAFIKNENETVYQVFTHRGLGGFGWTTSAKILNPEGNEKLGDFQISKQQLPDFLSVTINFPKTEEKDVLNKILVLGCCLILIKEY